MKITRTSGLAAIAAAAALVLTACGSDAPTTPTALVSAAQNLTSDAGSIVASMTSEAGGSGEAPTSSGEAPTSSGEAPTSSGEAPTSSGEAPTSSGEAPAAGVTFAAAGFKCATGELRSSGSTAQGKAIDAWIKSYNSKCSAKINDYGGGGSGKGVTDFTANQTDFAGSDSSLKDDQTAPAKARCKGADAINLPLVTGPIAIAYKLEGVTDLTLTPAVLAGIFDDKITNWNAPEIAEANPGLTLPDVPIQSVHRSEDSGTTENFVKYLKANTDWAYEGGKAWEATGGTGAQGSDGVAAEVAKADGTIGYVEWGFATANNLSVAKIDNGGGAVVLSNESAGKAVTAAKVKGTAPDLALDIDYKTKEAGAYPIILVTYEIVCSKNNGDKAELVKSFLGYAATDGQAELEAVGAAPLPAELQKQVIESIKGLS